MGPERLCAVYCLSPGILPFHYSDFHYSDASRSGDQGPRRQSVLEICTTNLNIDKGKMPMQTKVRTLYPVTPVYVKHPLVFSAYGVRGITSNRGDL